MAKEQELSSIGERISGKISICLGDEKRLLVEPTTPFRFRMVLVLAGKGSMRVNGNEIPVLSPCLFCLDENATVDVSRIEGLSARMMLFHPGVVNRYYKLTALRGAAEEIEAMQRADLYLLAPFLERTAEWQGVLNGAHAFVQRLSEAMSRVEDELQQERDEIWTCRARSGLLEALFLVERLYRNHQLEPSRFLHIEGRGNVEEQVFLHLHAHYHEKLTLDELARQFGTNRTTLNNKFRQKYGATVAECLQAIRLKMAAILLRDSDLPVGEIAYRTGLIDQTNFGRQFKTAYGTTPRDFRKAQTWLSHSA